MNKTFSRHIYSERINSVIDYISEHISEDISLETLSAVACFSMFHFHRIFTAFTGETPRDYIERVKLEKAANHLCVMPNKSVSEIAFEFGFSSASSFCRAFRKYYKVSPSKYLEKHRENFPYINVPKEKQLKIHKKESFSSVLIKNLPSLHVAYIQTLNGYSEGIPKSWKQLIQYMTRHDLTEPEAWYVGIPFDNPGITPRTECRYRACLGVKDTYVQTKGEVKTSDIEGGKYAIYHFKGRREDISDAYTFLYGEWLPQSGYTPDKKPLLEIYPPELHQSPYMDVLEYDIALPVKPL